MKTAVEVTDQKVKAFHIRQNLSEILGYMQFTSIKYNFTEEIEAFQLIIPFTLATKNLSQNGGPIILIQMLML